MSAPRSPHRALALAFGFALPLAATAAQAQDTTPPSAPATVAEGGASADVDYDGDGKYKVAWSKATDSQSGIAAYEVQEQAGVGGAWVTLTSTATSRSWPVAGKPDGARLFYRVRARNGAGLWGPFSNSSDGLLIDKTAPAAVTVTDDGATTPSHDSLHAAWTPSSDPQSGIAYYRTRLRNTTAGLTVVNWQSIGNVTQWTFAGLTLQTGHRYVIEVRAVNRAGLLSPTRASNGIVVVDGDTVPSQPSQISRNGRQLIVRRRNPDGSLAPEIAWVMRGINWSPSDRDTNTSSTDINNAAKRRPEFGDHYLTDIPLLQALGVNTVRLYLDPGLPGDPNVTVPGLQILDALYLANIMVVMTVDNANNTVSRIQPVVNHYKNHPAVLMWSLGNEFNMNRFYGKFPDVETAAQAMESAAQLVKAADAAHPVVASYGNLDVKPDDIERYVNVVCPSIDVWSFNVFRGPGFARLFDQWGFISTKPMFLGEFGLDAWNSVTNTEDQATHAAWVGQLWDQIARNLSAVNANRSAIGGAAFEFQDEYWKTPPYNTQETTGWNAPGFPDQTASEDIWGITTIDREPRQAYFALQTRFAPGYVPPPAPSSITHRVESLFDITARFWENGAFWYAGLGASLNGGRGFNIAAINTATRRLIHPIQRFDTYQTRNSGEAMTAMNAFLDSVPNGTLLLIAVGDEAGINHFPGDPQGRCGVLPYAWVSQALSRFTALGATMLNGYCYQDQWSLITIKGQGVALDEALGNGASHAVSEATVTVP